MATKSCSLRAVAIQTFSFWSPGRLVKGLPAAFVTSMHNFSLGELLNPEWHRVEHRLRTQGSSLASASAIAATGQHLERRASPESR